MMPCPLCDKWASVLETRLRQSPAPAIRRRYECANGHRYTTYERVAPQTVKEKK